MRRNYLRLVLFMALLCCWIFIPGPIFGASQGISKTEILIGQSCALKGPYQALGKGMRDGALTYFHYINSMGGIRGKKIRLISYDDGYEPNACIENSKKLINEDGVFLLFGYVGTRASMAAVPLAIREGIPYFAPLSGAEFLRDQAIRYVFNIRASYYQETETMVERLIADKGIRRISVFYQNDFYGKAGLEGVRRALSKRDLEILNEVHYPPDTVEVVPAVKALLITKPGAIIMIGTCSPSARFVQLMREAESESIFLNISSVGADALAGLLMNQGIGVTITQVVPYPFDTRVPAVAQFHQLAKRFMPKVEPNFINMEGFIAAKALCKILLDIPSSITREGFIKSAENQTNVDLGGFFFSFSQDNHQGSDFVSLFQVGPGGYVSPIENLRQLYDYYR